MNFYFADKNLQRLFTEDAGPLKGKFPDPVIERFFGAMQKVAAAADERDLRALKGSRMEKVPSECEGCYSIRLNDQFRLIFRLRSEKVDGHLEQVMEVVDVRDYH